ncbi:YncE family protein [Novosphingobium sp.]|uniref:YncE family protein n=1 Tax=Novosphingobium sp. TaxID=1874826 RepID=UPI003BA93FD5
MTKLGLAIAALLAGATPAHASTVFMGSYPDKMLIVDEATGTVKDRITLASGLPTSMRISNDNKKIYVTTITTSGIEVIDTATKKVVNSFSLNTPTTRYRFNGGVPDPSGKFFYTTLQKFEKLQDRWLVSPQMFAVIDLTKKAVTRTAEVPEEDSRNPNAGWRTGYMMSNDGKTLFLIRDKVLIVDTADLKVKDRLEVSKPEATGIEGVSFGGGVETLRSATEYVSMFTAQDPYIRNKVYGVGRFNLATKAFDFRPIGPAPVGGGMGGLQVSKDMKEGWTVVTQEKVGNKRCEFWHLDLTTNLVKNKAEFPCRSRFQFGSSGDSKLLYIYGASYDIEMYDAQTLQHVKTVDLGNDTTGAGMIITQ